MKQLYPLPGSLQTSFAAGARSAFCCAPTPNQFFFGDAHVPLLHHCPASQPASASHLVSMPSFEKHALFLQTPDWHSASVSQLKPVPFFESLQPGNSGGHSVPAGPEHFFGGG